MQTVGSMVKFKIFKNSHGEMHPSYNFITFTQFLFVFSFHFLFLSPGDRIVRNRYSHRFIEINFASVQKLCKCPILDLKIWICFCAAFCADKIYIYVQEFMLMVIVHGMLFCPYELGNMGVNLASKSRGSW